MTITRRATIREILDRIRPFVIFKRQQVERGLGLLERLPPPLEPLGFLEVCRAVDSFASLNFSKHRTVTTATVAAAWRSMGVLVPVTTDPQGETSATAVGLNLLPE